MVLAVMREAERAATTGSDAAATSDPAATTERSPSSPPIAAGDVLAGRYRVERILGVGGMGVVVAATQIDLERRVAIKVLLPSALENAGALERFAREARALSRLTTEHVTRVLEVGELESGLPFLVMEFLEGTDLAAL